MKWISTIRLTLSIALALLLWTMTGCSQRSVSEPDCLEESTDCACTSDTSCPEGSACTDGVCVSPQPEGEVCTSEVEATLVTPSMTAPGRVVSFTTDCRLPDAATLHLDASPTSFARLGPMTYSLAIPMDVPQGPATLTLRAGQAQAELSLIVGPPPARAEDARATLEEFLALARAQVASLNDERFRVAALAEFEEAEETLATLSEEEIEAVALFVASNPEVLALQEKAVCQDSIGRNRRIACYVVELVFLATTGALGGFMVAASKEVALTGIGAKPAVLIGGLGYLTLLATAYRLLDVLLSLQGDAVMLVSFESLLPKTDVESGVPFSFTHTGLFVVPSQAGAGEQELARALAARDILATVADALNTIGIALEVPPAGQIEEEDELPQEAVTVTLETGSDAQAVIEGTTITLTTTSPSPVPTTLRIRYEVPGINVREQTLSLLVAPPVGCDGNRDGRADVSCCDDQQVEGCLPGKCEELAGADHCADRMDAGMDMGGMDMGGIDSMGMGNNPQDMGPVADSGTDMNTCVPQTDAALCARAGAECGTLSLTDDCDNARTIDCGGCAAGQACSQNMCRG